MNESTMKVFSVLLVVLYCITANRQYRSDQYPTRVDKYPIRRDIYTNETVSSGRVHKLLKRTTMSEFKKHMQCSARYPDLNYNSATMSMLRDTPFTVDAIKLTCACIESQQYYLKGSLSKCYQSMLDYEHGKYPTAETFNRVNLYSFVQLLRVIRGTLYFDWPWGISRFKAEQINTNTLVPLLKLTVDKLTDLKDSIFFVGGDDPSFPTYSGALPMLSHSTSDSYTEMVFPWYEMWEDATLVYLKLRKRGQNFTEWDYKVSEPGYREWNQKKPKAALYARMFRNRQFMFYQARLRPDLIDAYFPDFDCVEAWNPSSNESCTNYHPQPSSTSNTSSLTGYAEALLALSGTKSRTYFPGSYKYVVVPLGNAPGVGLSTSSRIQHILAQSGAVVLMPRSKYKFHVSAQFLPWVHYVPLSFSGADLVEKIQWLQDHDDLARQIAENGRNFARSYLRLEDYYCYALNVLDAMAVLSAKGNASQVRWKPQYIRGLAVRFEKKEVLKWPK